MKQGFTGTRGGMSSEQQNVVSGLFKTASEVHLGDCVGSDEEAYALARKLGKWTVGHPPDNPTKRAWCEYQETRPEAPYLVRNRNIVDETEELVATPRGPEVLRSGTWSTIRYAMKMRKTVTIVMPSGMTVRKEAPHG